MTQVPAVISSTFPTEAQAAIDGWWAGLSDGERQTVTTLCDERQDACFFGVAADDDAPSVVGTDAVDAEDGSDDFDGEYREYLQNNPELMLVWKKPKVYYTCTQHPPAQACAHAGSVPAGFTCPVQPGNCLMEPLAGTRFRRLRQSGDA